MNSFWKFFKGIMLRGEATDPTDNLEGSLWYNSTDDRFKGYAQSAVRDLVTEDQAQTLTNKTINSPTIINPTITVDDNNFTIRDDASPTRLAQFSAGGITAGTTRTFTFPDTNGTLTLNDAVQTLSNKTINTTNNITIRDDSFVIQRFNDLTKQLVFDVNDIPTGTTRTLTVPSVSGVITLNNATQTLSNKTLDNTNTLAIKDNNFTLQDNGDATKQAQFQLSGISTGTLRTFTLPNENDTLVGVDTPQILTNKTIDGDVNTIQDLALTSLKTNITDAGKFLVRNGSGVVVSNSRDVPNGIVVGTTDTQTLTNKTISSTGNTINGFPANRVIISSAAGEITSEAQLAITRGGTGQATATAAFDALSPTTTKGDLITRNATTNIRVPVGTNGQILSADSTQASGLLWTTLATDLDQSQDVSNLTFDATSSAGTMTIALKTKAGTNPSAGDPVRVGFKSITNDGRYNIRTVSTSLSFVLNSGSTLGTTSGATQYVYVYGVDSGAGSFVLGASLSQYDEGMLHTTVAEGGGTATSNRSLYTTAVQSSKSVRLIGIITVVNTAGAWASPSQASVIPFQKKVVAFKARSSTTSFLSGTQNTFIFGTEVLDTKNMYDATTGIATAPETGLYAVTCRITWASNAAAAAGRTFSISTSTNGTSPGNNDAASPVDYSFSTTAREYSNLLSGTMYLSAGDTIRVVGNQNSGNTVAAAGGGTENYFAMVKIGDF